MYQFFVPHRVPVTAPEGAAAKHASTRERGFTVVELLVVMLIIAIVFLSGLASLDGSKGRSQSARARTVAVQLGEAVQQFQRDHGGRPPGAPGTVDWGNGWISPVDRGNGNRPYLSARAVEAVSDGAVSIEAANGRTGPRPNPTARVRYLADPARNAYVFVAYVDRGSALRAECYASNGEAASIAPLIRAVGVTRRC